MKTQMQKQTRQTTEIRERQIENVVEDLDRFLAYLIERGAEARTNLLDRLRERLYYSEQFQWHVVEIARAEAVERECLTIRSYLNDSAADDNLAERLTNITQQIDRRRKDFRVNISRSTCGIRNEIENAETEARHGFLFNSGKVSDADRIQKFCREGLDAL